RAEPPVQRSAVAAGEATGPAADPPADLPDLPDRGGGAQHAVTGEVADGAAAGVGHPYRVRAGGEHRGERIVEGAAQGEIGRASGRERVQVAGCAGWWG